MRTRFYVSDKFIRSLEKGEKLQHVMNEKRTYMYPHLIDIHIQKANSLELKYLCREELRPTHQYGGYIKLPERPLFDLTKEDADNIKNLMQEKLNMDRYRRPLKEKMDRLKAELTSALILAGGDHKQKLIEGSFDQVIRSILSNVSKEQVIKTISEFYEN